jgi:hypothetical protein
MDHRVRFKLIAKTDDPALLFDDTQMDPSSFDANYEFPQTELQHAHPQLLVIDGPILGPALSRSASLAARFSSNRRWSLCQEGSEGRLCGSPTAPTQRT